MSSVTMAADSTQADFTQHRRVRPAGKAALVQLGLRRGRQHVHRRDRSRSRHRSSSSRSRKQKRHSKEHQVKKSRRLRNSSRSRSHDDTSDRDSDLDLSKDLLPISGYVRIKDEMVDHMFRSISNRKLRAMLPEILRPLSSDELRRLCVEQLEVMSKKRVCRILGGADPDMISSSGTEEYDEDEEEDSSGRSHDVEDDVPNVGSAYAENEVVNSTALPAAEDGLPLKDSDVTSHAEIHDDDGNNRKDNPVVNSSRNKELDSTGRDSHATAEGDNGAATDGKMEAEDDGDGTSTVVEKASRIDHGGLDGDEIFGITIKLNDEARFGVDDMDGSADVGASQEESVRMSRRNFERSYRAKQLDDDERENESDGGGGGRQRNVREKGGSSVGVVVVAHSRPKRSKEEAVMSDGESIPNSLPSLDSEPEETCCPFVFFDTKSSQELKKVVESEQRNSLSGKSPDATLTTGASDSKEASTDCDLTASQDRLTHGKNSSVDPLVCPDGGATTTHAADKTRERKEETVSDGSERENVDDKSRKKSSPSQSRTNVEPANDSEEMIIEVHEHEFSDDGCDGDDAGFERERENDVKKGTEDSEKDDEISKEIPRRKEVKGWDVHCEETKLTDDDKRIGLSEKLELENTRGEEDGTVIPGRIKGSGSEQRPLKRKSVEMADEVLQAKMQKVVGKAATSGEHQSEERSESNSEQRKCVRMKNSSPTDAKAVPSSRADLQSENRPSNASDACHRSESAGSSRASALVPNPKRDGSLASNPTEQNVGKSPSKLSQASSSEDTVSSRKVARTGNPDAGSRSRVDRPELQISSSRAESAENVENAGGRVPNSKTPHRVTSHQKPGSADRAPPSSETGKEPATPILSKTQLEILELEMRARAIKAMLKAQEELEKREEKVKTDEKRRSVVPSAAVQLPRSSEGRSVIRPESKTIRIGAGYRGEANAAGPKSTGGADLAPRVVRSDVVAAPRQSQGKRLVERRPASALSEGASFTRTVQSSQVSVARPGFKPLQDVASNRFPTSAYRLVKRPLVASATRGRGGAATARGANSSCTGSRIVRLSSGPRADNRSVVPAQRLIAMRQTSGGPDKTAKMMAAGDREDVRRVVASSAVSVVRGSPAVKVTDSSLRYGNRNRVQAPSPNRDQKRSVVAWNRRGSGGYKQPANRAGRF